MIIVMMSAITATVSVNNALDAQYYNKLAQEAGESGAKMATVCIQAGTTTWTTLKPDTDCIGTSNGSSSYVLNTPSIRTSFSIPTPTIVNGVYTLNISSKVELLRTSNGQAWKTQNQAQAQSIRTTVLPVFSGNDTTCAISSGELYCWGKNDQGQVGNNTQVDQPSPVNISKSGTAATNALYGLTVYSVATGYHASCAIAGTQAVPTAGDNKVYCWGQNQFGQFGNGTASSTGPSNPTVRSLLPMQAGNGLNTTRVYTDIVMRDHVCLLNAALVTCWGQNQNGQAGNNDSDQWARDLPGTAPEDNNLWNPKWKPRYTVARQDTNGAITSVTSIAGTSNEGACAVSSGDVWCWGSNNNGQWGDDSKSGSPSEPNGWDSRAHKADTLTLATLVRTNYAHVCALNGNTPTTTAIWCWGSNGDKPDVKDFRISRSLNAAWAAKPVQISAFGTATRHITDFALADATTCYLTNLGEVYCWGYNDKGQLGQTADGPSVAAVNANNGLMTSSPERPLAPANAARVGGPLLNKTVVKITSGNYHFCATTSSAETYCWGGNDYGQLGAGYTTTTGCACVATPIKINVPTSIFQY